MIPRADAYREKHHLTKLQHYLDRQFPELLDVSHFRRDLLRWFEKNGRKFPWRKASTTKYQGVIAEILLQRTRAETVASFFPEFIREYPSWKQLCSTGLEHLQRYLQPIGLWRRRASSIKALAQEMAKRNGRFPSDREEIESLPGVGQYIANAILLICHGVQQPLLDVNSARVLERVFGPRRLVDIRYDPYLQSLAKLVVDCEEAKEMNWAILDLAALVCIPRNPRCNVCPLAKLCLYKSNLD